MTSILVLFNLKPDADLTDYENWAKAKDIPLVQSLKSVHDFKVFKMGN